MNACDFLFRAATDTDVPALAQLHVTTFAETHGGPGPICTVRERQWRESFSNALTIGSASSSSVPMASWWASLKASHITISLGTPASRTRSTSYASTIGAGWEGGC